MAKIHRVIEIKLNPLVEENMSTWSLTYQQIVFVRYHRDRHSSEFLTARWRQKSTGIDMEQNYVTVTLSIVRLLFVTLVVRRWWRSGTAVTSLVESTTLLHPRGRCHSPHRYTHWLEHGRRNRSGRPDRCRTNNLTNRNFSVHVRPTSTFVNVKWTLIVLSLWPPCRFL